MTESDKLTRTGLHAALTEHIIGCAIEVHRHLGPGLLESVYETAMCCEMGLNGLSMSRQVLVPVFYKGCVISEFRPDLIVNGLVVVEIKTLTHIDPIHVAQLLTYLRVTGLRVGLLLNFNTEVLKNGIRRVVL